MGTEQLMSYTRTALVDTVDSLQGPKGGVVAASEMHILLTKIADILDISVSKWVGNTAHTLTYLLNSTSFQNHEV